MRKLVIFHPAIVPYRIDFFNSLNAAFDASFYFLYLDAKEQPFHQDSLIKRLGFTPKYLPRGLGGFKNLRLEVLSILRKEKPDVVFLSEFNLMGFPVLLYKFLFNRRLKTYTICDDSRNIAAGTSGLQSVMRYFLVKMYDGIILASTDAMDWYGQTFKNESKFIYFPIIQEDTTYRSLLKKALPTANEFIKQYQLKGKNTILFVGRLIEIKNIPVLIHAFSRIHAQYPDNILILVGEGELLEALKRQAIRSGISDVVIFAGKQQGTALFAWYNIGQIFVLPSYFERFGAVVNEALLAGCYTLCSSAAGAGSLIDASSGNGSCFDPSSVEELERKLAQALNHQEALSDEASVKPNKMGKSYREYFCDFIQQLK